MITIRRYVLTDWDSNTFDYEYDNYAYALSDARTYHKRLSERIYVYDDTHLLEDYTGHGVPDRIILTLPQETDSETFIEALCEMLYEIAVEQASTGELYNLSRCTVTQDEQTGDLCAWLYDKRGDEMDVPEELNTLLHSIREGMK